MITTILVIAVTIITTKIIIKIKTTPTMILKEIDINGMKNNSNNIHKIIKQLLITNIPTTVAAAAKITIIIMANS